MNIKWSPWVQGRDWSSLCFFWITEHNLIFPGVWILLIHEDFLTFQSNKSYHSQMHTSFTSNYTFVSWRIDAFELWCWRRLLRIPWTARRSNQSILKEISPGYSLEGLMLKLELQYFGYLMRRVDSFEKTLMLRNIEGRRRGQQRMRWLDGITNQWTSVWANSGRWWRTEKPGVLQFMGSPRVRHDWATEQQQEWERGYNHGY